MAQIAFKKGLLSKLPATYSEGTFYVTTDERAIYLDVSDSARIRLGDFIEFPDLASLQANTNPSTTALYYVADINCLAKWDGGQYIQINRDSGATSVEVVGDGNAVTAASYDPATRKLTLTMGGTFATGAEHDELKGYVGTIPEGYTESNIVAYINKKAVETLEAATGDGGESAASVKAALEAYKAENDPKVAANTEAAAAAQTAADDAQADVDALEALVGTVTEGKTVVEMIADAQTAATYDDTQVKADIAQNASDIKAISDDYLKAADKTELQGNIDKKADKTVVDALIGDDTGKSVRAIANDELVKQLIPETAKESLDTLAEIAAWIQSHPDDAAAMNLAIEALQAKVDTGDQKVSEYVTAAIAALNIGDYAKAADLTLVANRVTALEGVVGDAEGGLVKVVADNTAAIATKAAQTDLDALNGRMDTAEGKIEALEGTSHTHDNASVLDGITSEKVGAWDGAVADVAVLKGDETTEGSVAKVLKDAKDYADGLNNDMNTRVDALEALTQWGTF